MKSYIRCTFGKCGEHGRRLGKAALWVIRLAIFLVLATGLTFVASLCHISGISLRSLELFAGLVTDRLFPEFRLFTGGQE